ncbi:type II toxin-antitoxin system VapB family antitoxin [Sphingomonas sp. AR_OL41]|uniref:antitoxin n=1 Tax=Sphingomonas sp. AR_OL41 TaxID=3042729 RepID=UPI00247FEA70|nr:type II toxin-antitoxin system VapB family antitoxin [Sphingomonas sp. AR_OL41]MDH7976043.1 type II toxin-antitoxin system VapB family antitoxin [Sphingomonas sp. AR_OL41]
MNDMAKIFWNGRSQAVRLPKAYRFATSEVSIRREGDNVILEPATGDQQDLDAATDAMGDDVARRIDQLRALIDAGADSGDAGEWNADEIRRIARGGGMADDD